MEKEIHLIEKRRKGLLSLIFSRTGVIIILFALAVLTALSVMNWFAGLIAHISAGIILFNVIVIVYLVNSEMDSSATVLSLYEIIAWERCYKRRT